MIWLKFILNFEEEKADLDHYYVLLDRKYIVQLIASHAGRILNFCFELFFLTFFFRNLDGTRIRAVNDEKKLEEARKRKIEKDAEVRFFKFT